MQVLLWAIIIFMLVRIYIMNKRTKKSKQLIATVNSINDKDEFFKNVEAFEETMKDDPEFLNKGRVIHVWGMAFHKVIDGLDDEIDSIDLKAFMKQGKRKGLDITDDEDAFFYMYLAIPNILDKNGMITYRKKVREKVESVSEELNNQLVKNLGDALNLYYEKQDDKGLSFYEKVLNGEYGEYAYSKQLIGLYKSICAAQAARLYKDDNNTEKYEELNDYLENFTTTGLGERWLKSLNLEVKKKEETEENKEVETFDVSDEDKE